MCNREVMLKILADDRYCGRVIGKEGKVIKKIREDTDTHIVVSKSVLLLTRFYSVMMPFAFEYDFFN